MANNLMKIDEVLIKNNTNTEDYKKNKSLVLENIQDISNKTGLFENDLVNFSANYFRLKKDVSPVSLVLNALESVDEYKKDIINFLPLLLTIKTVNYIETEEEVIHLFKSLCKKVKFSAAELGDEDNLSYIRACVLITDYSFFEELEVKGHVVDAKHLNFSDVINDEFKKDLSERIDEKVELLNHLKKEIFSDDELLFSKIESVATSKVEKNTVVSQSTNS